MQLAKKVNARDEFVRPTWIDLSSPATAPEILLLLQQKTFQRRQKHVLTGGCSCLDSPQQRHEESFCYGYSFRDFLGKYAKDFPMALEPCVGVPSKRKG